MNEFVKYKMESGRYASVSEYFRELIKLDQEREMARIEEFKRQERLQNMRASARNYR
jgi:putative addiction module CopG family antidote